jgi:hypothetical protein
VGSTLVKILEQSQTSANTPPDTFARVIRTLMDQGDSKGSNKNIAEIYQQVLMMLGHEIFGPQTNSRVLVDHTFIVAGCEITKAARTWLGGKLDATKRSQIMFMDSDDILNLYVVTIYPA